MFTTTGTLPGIETAITVRQLSMQQDLTLAMQILNRQHPGPKSPSRLGRREVNNIYTAIMHSPGSSAWLAFSGELPLFILEIHQARYYDTPRGLVVSDTDYVTDLLINPQPLLGLSEYTAGLKACITCCKEQAPIEKLFAPVHSGLYHSHVRDIFLLTGFTNATEATRETGREILHYRP